MSESKDVDEEEIEVNMGNELSPSQTKHAPIKISWTNETDKKNNYYTLMMLDPGK